MQENLIMIGQCKIYAQNTLILFQIINYFKYLKLNDSAVLQVKIYCLAIQMNLIDIQIRAFTTMENHKHGLNLLLTIRSNVNMKITIHVY